MTLDPDVFLRDHIVQGDPNSGVYGPAKSPLRQALKSIGRLAAGNTLNVKTLAELQAITGASNQGAFVWGDDAPTNNGMYRWDADGSPADWEKIAGLPHTAAVLSNIAGTANAITADTETGVDPGEAKVLLLIPESTNTDTSVSLALNGSPVEEDIKDASGNDPEVGALVAATGTILFRDADNTHWRQLFPSNVLPEAQSARDTAVSAAAAAEADRIRAEDAETDADGFAAAAQAAAEASGNVVFYDTYAEAVGALGGLSENQIVEVNADENRIGGRSRYRVESSALVFKSDLYSTGFAAGVSYQVGSGGDFASVSEALQYVSTRRNFFISGGVTITLNLVSGFVLSEQVILDGIDLSFVRITATDAETVIDRSALTTAVDPEAPDGGGVRYPAFAVKNGAKLPRLACLFNMDSSGIAGSRDGLLLTNGSYAVVEPGAGIKNADAVGIYNIKGSCCVANGAILDGSGDRGFWNRWNAIGHFDEGSADGCGWTAFQCHASYGSCENATLTNSAHYGVRSRRGSKVNAQGADVSGSAGHGVNCNEGSELNFRDGTAVGCAVTDNEQAVIATEGSKIAAMGATITGAGTNALLARGAAKIDFRNGTASSSGADPAIRVQYGGEINAGGATGSTSQRVNVLSGEGIIWDNTVPLSADWTPALEGTSVSGSQTYSVQTGRYTIHGSMVTVWFKIELSAFDGATSGNLRIDGMPSSLNPLNGNSEGGVVRFIDGIGTLPSDFQGGWHLDAAGGYIQLRYTNDSGNVASAPANVGSSSLRLYGSITYEIDIS